LEGVCPQPTLDLPLPTRYDHYVFCFHIPISPDQGSPTISASASTASAITQQMGAEYTLKLQREESKRVFVANYFSFPVDRQVCVCPMRRLHRPY